MALLTPPLTPCRQLTLLHRTPQLEIYKDAKPPFDACVTSMCLETVAGPTLYLFSEIVHLDNGTLCPELCVREDVPHSGDK